MKTTLTKAEMLQVCNNGDFLVQWKDGTQVLCADDGQTYLLNTSATNDSTTGKFRAVSHTYHTDVHLDNTSGVATVIGRLRYVAFGDGVIKGKTYGPAWDSTNSTWGATSTGIWFITRENYFTTFVRYASPVSVQGGPAASTIPGGTGVNRPLMGNYAELNAAFSEITGSPKILTQLQTNMSATEHCNILFLAAGVNDYLNQIAPNTFRSDVATAFDYLKTNKYSYTDVVVILPLGQETALKQGTRTYSLDTYRQIEYEEAIKRGFSVVDTSDYLVKKTQSGYTNTSWSSESTTVSSAVLNNVGCFVDGYHLGNPGHRIVGYKLARDVLGIVNTNTSHYTSQTQPIDPGEFYMDNFQQKSVSTLSLYQNMKSSTTAEIIITDVDPYFGDMTVKSAQGVVTMKPTSSDVQTVYPLPYYDGTKYVRFKVSAGDTSNSYRGAKVTIETNITGYDLLNCYMDLKYLTMTKQYAYDTAI